MVKNDLPAGAAVYADPLIVKVFYNLAEHAARFGEKITTIRFSGEERGGDYLIFCKDDGIGIPAGVKEKNIRAGIRAEHRAWSLPRTVDSRYHRHHHPQDR